MPMPASGRARAARFWHRRCCLARLLECQNRCGARAKIEPPTPAAASTLERRRRPLVKGRPTGSGRRRRPKIDRGRGTDSNHPTWTEAAAPTQTTQRRPRPRHRREPGDPQPNGVAKSRKTYAFSQPAAVTKRHGRALTRGPATPTLPMAVEGARSHPPLAVWRPQPAAGSSPTTGSNRPPAPPRPRRSARNAPSSSTPTGRHPTASCGVTGPRAALSAPASAHCNASLQVSPPAGRTTHRG